MRCIENFDLTSEALLGLSSFPEETCPYNYPIADFIGDLGEYIEAFKIGNNALTSPDFDQYSHHALSLVETTASFQSWLDDWVHFYATFKDELSKDNRQFIKYHINDIKQYQKQYLLRVRDIESMLDHLSSLPNSIVDIYDTYCEQMNEYHISMQELANERSEIEYEINRSGSDDFKALIDSRKHILTLISEKEANAPSLNNMLEDTETALEGYSQFFGNTAQVRFSTLRAKIISLKLLIKNEALGLDFIGKDIIISKPIARLRKKYSTDLDDDTTLYCATPITFVQRCQKMENEIERLCHTDKKRLNSGSLDMAVKRFLIDYPEYEHIVWFTNIKEAQLDRKSDVYSLSKHATSTV